MHNLTSSEETFKGPKPHATVEEAFTFHIEQLRQQLEKLCIQKAKLETLQLHKYPYEDLKHLINMW